MKKIVLTMLIMTGLLCAESYTKADRIKDMHKMAGGMKLIQNGFLYRCPEHSCLIDGAERILGVVKTLETQEMKDFLPEDQKYAYKFGQKSARMIELYAKDLIDSAKSNNMDDALEDYNQILRQCASCHLRLRK
ncbi:hypothetical protein [Hydrogenimonas thermophila]|uniref:Cytochrome C n=1 Tax=Hydrogenimonas thermophila TaxID=223786 RepID=A0A1I5U866_9BACT|nr:hypothetical protein [Hydrogenimonas thermophila]SFP91428.1 hypothetical protein SAMN05216234_15611 [Hydrogenimonas thermophila]